MNASGFRIESDALGSIELPADALYGIQTARAAANLSFSGRTLGSLPAYVWALGAVKRAAARANHEVDALDRRSTAAIEAACALLLDGQHLEAFPVDVLGGGGSIGINMNINEVVANLANEQLGSRRGTYQPIDPKRHVNLSQSTADVCHTALRIAILRQWPQVEGGLAALVRCLRDKAASFAAVPTLARTCLQDALPTHLGVLFGGYAELLDRRRHELAHSVVALRAVSLGGTVIGTGEAAAAGYAERVVGHLTETTGFALSRRGALPDALQNSDDIGAVSSQLALLAQALLKVAQDLRLLASGPRGGFAEIVLPHVQSGSSFFVAKSNPVIPETLMQCAFQVLGCDRAVQAAVEHAELYLNVFDGLAAVNVLDAFSMLAKSIALFEEKCLRDLKANEDRCRELAVFGKG
ncbi:MAG: aspartate ammonia-lyase [Deltaproteobacteria bacterium]|nr:aspartate ammonia-lyase [Deltaproteobacteria bacterium]